MSTLNNSLRNIMWVEKYRPQDLEQIVNQNEIIDGISNLLKNPEKEESKWSEKESNHSQPS